RQPRPCRPEKCSWIARSSPLLAKCDDGDVCRSPRARRTFVPAGPLTPVHCVERMAQVNDCGTFDFASAVRRRTVPPVDSLHRPAKNGEPRGHASHAAAEWRDRRRAFWQNVTAQVELCGPDGWKQDLWVLHEG